MSRRRHPEHDVASEQFQNLIGAMKAQRTAEVPSIPELRVGMDALGQLSPAPEGLELVDVDAGGVPARWVVAPGSSEQVVFYLHGGGYCIGSPVSHGNLAGRLSAATGARVLLVDYRLAPEHPYPAAVEDAVAAYRWLLDEGTGPLGRAAGSADPGDIVVAGDSAGGGLSVALLVSARDQGIALPLAAALISPWTDLDKLGPISDAGLDVDYLRPETLEVFAEAYLDGTDPGDPLASPGLADLSGLPPMLVFAGEHEILLDVAQRLAARAQDAGVDVELVVAAEMPHVPQYFAGMFPEADEATVSVASFIRRHLDG